MTTAATAASTSTLVPRKAALTRWATVDRKKINAEIAAKAHEEWQAKQFWMTRGAQGQQKPSHF
jgi:hypothetical protein